MITFRHVIASSLKIGFSIERSILIELKLPKVGERTVPYRHRFIFVPWTRIVVSPPSKLPSNPSKTPL
jgi:hypothetical protein